MNLMFQPLRRYADFRGRATRSEFWMFQLFILLVWSAVSMITSIVGAILQPQSPDAATAVFWLGLLAVVAGLFLPGLAVMVRRLHDSDASGWLALLAVVPFGGAVLFVFSLIPGTAGPNRHGPNPRDSAAPAGLAAPG